MQNDLINHPAHYKTENGLEAIDVIEAFTDGLNGSEATHTGNVLKYMCRWKKKNGLTDLKKAQWYLNRLIEKIEEHEKSDDYDVEFNLEFDNPKDADEAFHNLYKILETYGSVTVVDINDLRGLPSSYTDNECGWKSLDHVIIAYKEEKFYLEMGKPIKL